MIKSMPMWAISLLVVALLATQVGYLLLEREQSHPVVPPDSNFSEEVFVSSDQGRAASAARDTGKAGRSQATASQSGLQERLSKMTQPERNQILYLMVRDAGARCAEIMSSRYVIADGAWLAHCEETQTYSIAIDGFGSISVYPIPYFTPVQIPEPR